MNVLALLLLSILAGPIDIGKIGKINAAKSAARKAYQSGDYETAAKHYQYLIDSLGVREDEVFMNLGNAKLNLGDTTAAVGQYQSLSASTNTSIRSNAYQQMGVVKTKQGKLEEALDDFRQALRANPNNEQARYNYEVVKKKLDEQKKQDQQNNKNQDKKNDQKDNKDQKDQQKKDQQNQNKDQQNKDQEKKNQQNKEQKEGEKKDDQQKKQDQQDQENQQKPKDSQQK
ncbi:MAG: tetratricopeptide repeat protein, partial [Bacteroidota bacterium]